MTLNIALELDHDGVRLLRVAGGGRTELGALRLDDPNFDTRIAALRNGICGEDTDVEVVLPPSLVLFLDVGEAAESEVRSRLKDETPCSLDDLIVGRDGAIAAAVERATLEEARDFAREHGFRPAAFAAMPGNGADGAISFRYEPLPPPSFRSHRPSPDERYDDAGPSGPSSPAPTGEDPPAGGPAAAGMRGGPEKDAPEAPVNAAADPFLTVTIEESVTEKGAEEPATAAEGSDAEPAISWRTTRQEAPGPSTERSRLFAASAPDASEPDRVEMPAIQFRATPLQTATDPGGAPAPDDADTSGAAAEGPEAPITFRHGAFDSEPEAEETPEPAPITTPPSPAADASRLGFQRPERAPAAPTLGRKTAAPAVPSLATPRVKPAKTEADALTIFGARGEPVPKARGFTMLHAAAALLAAGVLFAAYELLQGDMAELDIVNLEEIATGAIDPLTEAGDETAGAVEPGATASTAGSDTEPAALDPAVSVTPAPRPDDPATEVVIDAPQSELATPVALPDPIEFDTPAQLAAPVLPQRPDEAAPGAFTPPPPPGTVFDMDERGLVRPTEDGAMTPQGVMVHSGQPVTLPPAEALAAPESPAQPDEEVAETQDDAALAPRAEAPTPEAPATTAQEIPRIRPLVRPEDVVTGPVVTALAAGEDTPRPVARPQSVAAAVAAAASAADPDFEALAREAQAQTAAAGTGTAAAPRATAPPPPEPEGRANVSVQPSLPTRASVAERATVQNALHLNRVNLIGVYGTASDRRALIRLPTGRYIKVKVGDSVDGGRVASIQNSHVEYVKGGRRYDLSLPSG